MFEIIVIILIIFGVIAVATLIFGAWLLVVIVRGAGRLFGLSANRRHHARGGHLPHGPALLPPPLPGQERCDRQRCHATNPSGVSFCRRCGSRLNAMVMAQPSPLRERSRRAAML